ncbi:unnamed protein product [Ectocarpus sp. 4 AP-2014]
MRYYSDLFPCEDLLTSVGCRTACQPKPTVVTALSSVAKNVFCTTTEVYPAFHLICNVIMAERVKGGRRHRRRCIRTVGTNTLGQSRRGVTSRLPGVLYFRRIHARRWLGRRFSCTL